MENDFGCKQCQSEFRKGANSCKFCGTDLEGYRKLYKLAGMNYEGGNLKRPCPVCNEIIATGAKKCRFCGEWLTKRGSNGIVHGSVAARAVSQGIKMKNYSKMAFKTKLLFLILFLWALTAIASKALRLDESDALVGPVLFVIWVVIPIIAILISTKTYYRE